MDNILVLETEAESLKFLKTLPKYCNYNFIFSDSPGDAIDKIDELNIGVFVLPFEMKNYDAFDILFTASLAERKPLCILTSNATDMKNLLFCLNSYSVFKLVIKPFQNIIDMKKAIEEAVEFRHKYGIISDDVIVKMISESKEVSYWEKHNKMMDLNYLKCYQDIYFQNRFLDNKTLTSEEMMTVNMFIQDIHSSFIYYTTRVDNTLFDIIFNINHKLNSDTFSKGKIKFQKEVLNKNFDKNKFILTLIVLCAYIHYSSNAYELYMTIKEENGYVVIKSGVKSAEVIESIAKLLKKETDYLLGKLCEEHVVGSDKSILFGAGLIKING